MAIGLDIGTSSVRAAALEPHRGGPPRLGRHGEVGLPPGAVVDGEVVEAPVVADALRKLWGVAGLRGRDVAVGLASQKVSVRQFDLPDLPDEELGDAVRLQAQDQLPMPVDQALLDHVVVDRRQVDGERGSVRVLLVAAEHDMVERLLSAVTAAKLRPVLVDLDAFALLRSVVAGVSGHETEVPGHDTEVVVDVGAAVTKIAVHRGGNPLFVRMVRLGGDTVTRQLQERLDLSWEEAERAKLLASGFMAEGAELDPDDERARALEHGVQRVVNEIRHSLDFFRSQNEDVEVRSALLCGGGGLAPRLVERLHAAIEVPVAHGDPFRNLDHGNGGGEMRRPEDCRCLAVSVGLALGTLG